MQTERKGASGSRSNACDATVVPPGGGPDLQRCWKKRQTANTSLASENQHREGEKERVERCEVYGDSRDVTVRLHRHALAF